MIKSLVAIALMLGFAIGSAGSSFVAMLMYWWYALFRPHEWMWWDISAYRIPTIAAAMFLLYSFATKKFPKFDNTIHVFIGLIVLSTVVAQVVSACQSIYSLTYSHILILALTVLISARFLVSAGHVVTLILCISIFFSIHVSGLGIDLLLEGGSLYGVSVKIGAISGSNGVALASGMMVLLTLPMMYLLWTGNDQLLLPILKKKFIRIPLFLLISYNLIGLAGFVYGSDSRGSAISLMLGGLAWVLLLKKRFKWISILIFVVVVAFSANLVPEAYVDRIATVFVEEEDLDNSAASRPHFWNVAFLMAKSNPLGVGAGCYLSEYNSYDPTGGQFGFFRSSHSSYFNVLAELGMFGFLAWILLHITVLITLLKTYRLCGYIEMRGVNKEVSAIRVIVSALFSSHIAFLVGAVFYEFSYNDITWLTFVIAAACWRITRQVSANSNGEIGETA